ncbi:MAG: NAD-dependent epimerase/dehydratase family protein, partial [Phycisphaeraceae bacterium]|nr:NAD-dependent epimerase/dehydratase family protein [Phycisphaeraceae bacterium]
MTLPSPILITGAAGFIGSSLADRLLSLDVEVIGIDNFDPFYPRDRKQHHLAAARDHEAFHFYEQDIRDAEGLGEIFDRHRPAAICHLAALAGVRPSIERPAAYTDVNLSGTVNLLNHAVEHEVDRLCFASSSSVYGNNEKVPFAEADPVTDPISPYAATKRSGELLCHTFHHLYDLPIACLRFFTVYGPRQRPDLAISKFLRRVGAGEPIPVFGDGTSRRDYTFIEDILDGVLTAIERIPDHGFRIWNLGGDAPISLADLISLIEKTTGRDAIIDRQPDQPGDVRQTW